MKLDKEATAQQAEIEIANIVDMHLWAWVGVDDGPERSGELGLKQARTPAGMIPMVACTREKMAQPYIREQMGILTSATGVRRYRVRFRFEAIEEIVEP